MVWNFALRPACIISWSELTRHERNPYFLFIHCFQSFFSVFFWVHEECCSLIPLVCMQANCILYHACVCTVCMFSTHMCNVHMYSYTVCMYCTYVCIMYVQYFNYPNQYSTQTNSKDLTHTRSFFSQFVE